MANPKSLPSPAPVAPVAAAPAHAAPAPAASSDFKCEDYLPDFVCHPSLPELPSLPGVSDIPWWVWAVGGVGAAGFTTLAYASFKAAPYVLPYVNPDAAPLAKAWLRHRAGHDKIEIAHEAFQALREQRARAVPRTKEEIKALRDQHLKDTFADLLARRQMKQLAK